MVRRAIGMMGLSPLVLAAALAVGTVVAAPAVAEPVTLAPDALDAVAAGAPRKLKVLTLSQPTVAGTGLAALALKLAGQQRLAVAQPSGGTPSPDGGRVTTTGSGKKSFKADRVTKGHLETLVVSGSIAR